MLQFVLPALLGAAGSIGSVFLGNSMQQAENRRAERVAMEREDSKIQRVVDQSRAAGISPLVGLGSPAAGASASPVVDQSGSNIAGAGPAIFGNLAAQIAAMKTDAELEFQEAQTENMRASTAALLADARSRTMGAAIGARSRGGAIPHSNNLVLPPQTLDGAGGVHLKTSPSSTAQTVQDEYGDIVENVYGIVRLLNDAVVNLPNLPHGEGRGVGFEPLIRPFEE